MEAVKSKAETAVRGLFTQVDKGVKEFIKDVNFRNFFDEIIELVEIASKEVKFYSFTKTKESFMKIVQGSDSLNKK